jgi:hypothetical protein
MSSLRLSLLVAVACTAGCDTETIKTYPATNPGDVKVFRHAPKHPYEVLGTVRYVADFLPGNGQILSLTGSVLDGLREQAARRGADAVILLNQQVIDPEMDNVGDAVGESTKIWLKGLAIRFKRAGESSGPSPSHGPP